MNCRVAFNPRGVRALPTVIGGKWRVRCAFDTVASVFDRIVRVVRVGHQRN